LCYGLAWLVLLMIVFIIFKIGKSALPAMQERGLGFLTGTVWDPNQHEYGILPQIWGTLYSSLLALVIGTAFGLAAAIFLSEGYLASFVFELLKMFQLHFHPVWGALPDRIEQLLKNLIELLAAIPSVVYGFGWLSGVFPLR